jgi:hypothetical protein
MKPPLAAPLACALLALTLLSGCSTTDQAVFVTKTSLTVLDADTSPPALSIAYDRTEGFYGPAYENGAAAPVTAILQSNGNLLAPQVRQLYATGHAAEIVAGRAPAERAELGGRKRPMFFGTQTNIGLKLTFAAEQPVPTALHFGYKRKEASVIPIGTTGEGADARDHYPSAIAAIDNTNTLETAEGTTLRVTQFFATGAAADALAPGLRDTFAQRIDEAVEYRKNLSAQQTKAGEILALYPGVPHARRLEVWTEADKFGLFAETAEERGTLLAELSGPLAAALKDGKLTEAELPALAAADQLYAESLFHASAGFAPDRLSLLEQHLQTVLGLLPAQP